MTTTYDLTTLVGKVRLRVGDTDTANAVFTDEEITIFLTAEGNDVDLASAAVLEAWAAKYGTSADQEKMGDYSYSMKAVEKMLKLAATIREKAAGTPYMTWAELDLTGGSGITAEED